MSLWRKHLCRSHTGSEWETGWWTSTLWTTAVTVSPNDTKFTWSTSTNYTGAALTLRKLRPLAIWYAGQYFTRAGDETLHMLRDKGTAKKLQGNTLWGISPARNKRRQKEDWASFHSLFPSSYPKTVFLSGHSGFSAPRSFAERTLQCQF